MTTEATYEFPEEGVTVIVPDYPTLVEPKKNPPANEDHLVPFELCRQVINLKVVEKGKSDRIVTDYDPPITLQVRYTKDDHDFAAAKGRPLALADWNGGVWVRFLGLALHPDDPNDPSAGGYGEVKISSWVDPPIGWGA